MKIRFAATPPASALGPDEFPAYLERLESLGFDTLWLSDIPLGPLGDPLISLATAAACTRKLKLGANIVPLGRNPLFLAKQLAQLDQISNGRILLSFVPGLGPPVERAALGYAGRSEDRGANTEAIMDLLRRWWAGERVSASCEAYRFDDVAVSPCPLQQPLEIWLGGKAPAALKRVARLGDGWLTSAVTAAEAASARNTILEHAKSCDREIDTEHFGISMPYCFDEPDPAAVESLRVRRKDRDVSGIIAKGRDGLRDLVGAHLDAGLSKFVLRPLGALSENTDWRTDLDRTADAILDLQS